MAPGNKTAIAAAIATAIAIPAEGLRQWAYYDPPGVLSVCYGSTTDVELNRKYSLMECKARLDKDMLEAVEQVDACIPGLPTNVLAAFGDAVYNLGPTIACDRNHSQAARYLYKGMLLDACNQLPRWNKSTIAGIKVVLPGLTTRRAKERTVCLTPEPL